VVDKRPELVENSKQRNIGLTQKINAFVYAAISLFIPICL